MSIVCDVQKMCYKAEKESLGVDFMIKAMKEIEPNYYNSWLIVFMVGVSCASFAYLHGSDLSESSLLFLPLQLECIQDRYLLERSLYLLSPLESLLLLQHLLQPYQKSLI